MENLDITKPKQIDPNISEGLMHIEAVRNNIMGKYGNYDASEGAALDDIALKLTKGDIDVPEAKARANGVFDSKNFR